MMKNLFLLISAAAISCGSIFADNHSPKINNSSLSPYTADQAVTSQNDAPTRASEGFTLQFCDEIYQWSFAVQLNKANYKCYIYVPAEMATQIAGNKITDIRFSTASDYTSNLRDCSVFVAEDLDSDPVSETFGKAVNCYIQGSNGGDCFQTIELEEPYVIKENTPFYFGYTVKTVRYAPMTGRYDYPIGVDMKSANSFAGYVSITDAQNQYLGTLDMARDTGTNLYLAAKTVGTSGGFEDMFMLGNVTLGMFSLPLREVDDPTPLYFPIKNIGANPLTSFEYILSVNGVPVDSRTLAIDIAPNAEDFVEIPAPTYIPGRNNISINVLKVNGKEANISSQATCVAIEGEGFDRKFVVEEGTGTWCGYCPRGIVGLEYMAANHPEDFIGIAIHSGDEMEVASYNPLVSAFFSGFPSCVINRDPFFVIDPNKDDLEEAYQEWKSQRAFAKIDLNVQTDEKEFKVNATTTFAYDESSPSYALAFAILEDGIVSNQQNYFAGNPGSLEWWGDQGSRVQWTYEHTARDIFDCFGLAYINHNIVGNEPIDFTTTFSSKNVSDMSKTSVIAFVLDVTTGTILNAAKVEAKDYNTESSITQISADTTEELFDLTGRRVSAPSSGSILLRTGTSGSKIVRFN